MILLKIIKKENEIIFKYKEMKQPSNIVGYSTSAEYLDWFSYKLFDDDFSTINPHEHQSICMLTTDAITSEFTKR